MKQERKYTEQEAYEYALNEYHKLIKRKQKGLAKKIFNQCKEGGKAATKAGKNQPKTLRTVELQLVFLKDNPDTQLPVKELNHAETVQAWETGIADYKLDISFKATR